MTDLISLLRQSRSREYLVDCVRIDTRSLAVFRIGVGLLVIADVVSRSRNFSFYYTDDGIVPQTLAQADSHEYAISVFYLTSDPTLIAALLVAHVLVALALVAVVFVLNVGVIVDDGYDQHRLNHEVEQTTGGEYVHSVTAGLGIRQPEWSVFAPHPRTTDRYYVFGGTTTDGEQFDVYNDRAFTWDRPEPLQEQHDAYRERFFMNSVRRAGWGSELHRQYGEHICTVYEDEHGIELSHISMFEITERITMDNITDPEDRETEREHFYRHTCGE